MDIAFQHGHSECCAPPHARTVVCTQYIDTQTLAHKTHKYTHNTHTYTHTYTHTNTHTHTPVSPCVAPEEGGGMRVGFSLRIRSTMSRTATAAGPLPCGHERCDIYMHIYTYTHTYIYLLYVIYHLLYRHMCTRIVIHMHIFRVGQNCVYRI